MTPHLVLQWHDWLSLLGYYLFLSLLSVGGTISTVPAMHRYLVNEHHWLTDPQFNASIALAQAAPGPNILFVALMGWNVGLNADGLWTGFLGVCVTMTGILLPSTILTYQAANWAHRRREMRAVRAFKQGMGPIVVGLVGSTSWILASTPGATQPYWPLWLLTATTALIIWRTQKIHILWLLAAGALLGWFGVI